MAQTQADKEAEADDPTISTVIRPRPKLWSKRKKYLVFTFMAFCFWVQIKANLSLEYPYGLPIEKTHGTFAGKVYYAGELVDWGVDQLAWILGLSTRWRMFSPPPKSHWFYSIWAIFPDGRQEWIPLVEQQGKRNFWQRNFVDFRETKFHLNIYNQPEALDAFAQHLCYQLELNGEPVSAIRVTLMSRQFLPPNKVSDTGSRYDREIATEFGVYPCRTQ